MHSEDRYFHNSLLRGCIFNSPGVLLAEANPLFFSSQYYYILSRFQANSESLYKTIVFLSFHFQLHTYCNCLAFLFGKFVCKIPTFLLNLFFLYSMTFSSSFFLGGCKQFCTDIHWPGDSMHVGMGFCSSVQGLASSGQLMKSGLRSLDL